MPLVQLPSLIQTAFAEITTDTTTTSTTGATLLSLNFTATGACNIEVHHTICASCTAVGSITTAIAIDGVIQINTHLRILTAATSNCSSLHWMSKQAFGSTILPGVHTIAISWFTSTGTARVRPVSTVFEHASLLVKELGV